ncbi:hypothetical protein OY671_012252, partial [Metschnikowia pulcherrima]
RFTVFSTDERAMASTDGSNGAGDERSSVSEDGARHWSASSLREQVWPDADSYGRAFSEHSGPGRAATDQSVYGWSLYPSAADRAVGWSWRDRVTVGVARRIETRGFEVRFQDGASPAFRITHDVPPVPPQDPGSQPRVGQPEYATDDNRIYR